MAVPDRIKEHLLTPRNTIVHNGSNVTDRAAWAAITAARELVDEYEPIAEHCQEPPPYDDREPYVRVDE